MKDITQRSFPMIFVQLWIPVINIIFSAGVGYGFLNEQIALLNQKTSSIMAQNKAAVLTITTLQAQQNTIEIQVAKIQQILVDQQNKKLVSDTNTVQPSTLVSIPLNLYTENVAGNSAILVP